MIDTNSETPIFDWLILRMPLPGHKSMEPGGGFTYMVPAIKAMYEEGNRARMKKLLEPAENGIVLPMPDVDPKAIENMAENRVTVRTYLEKKYGKERIAALGNLPGMTPEERKEAIAQMRSRLTSGELNHD